MICLLKRRTGIFAQIRWVCRIAVLKFQSNKKLTENQTKWLTDDGSALVMSLFLTRGNFHAAHHMSPTRYISSVWHAEITKNNDKIAFEQLQRTWEIIHFIGLKFWYTGIQATRQRNWYNEKNREKRVAFDLHFWYFLFNSQKRHFFVSSNKISLMQQISAKDALWWNYHLDQKYFIVFYVVPWCIFHVLFFEHCVLCTNLMICINLQFLRT